MIEAALQSFAASGSPGWAAFALACLLIELTPGPNMVFLALLAASRGRAAGLAAVLGVTLGLLIVGALAALGVGALIARSGLAYETLRWGGAAYLIYLAVTQWIEAGRPAPDLPQAKARRLYFRHGLIVNLLNPKAALFYIAVLPGFINRAPQSGELSIAGQAGALTVIYVSIATFVHLVIIALAGSAAGLIQHPVRRRIVARALALLLVGVAIWLAIATAR